MVDAMLKSLAHAKHHGGRGAHAQLVRRAVDVKPIVGQAFQSRDLVTHFVVQNFRAAAGKRIKSRHAQPNDRSSIEGRSRRQSG